MREDLMLRLEEFKKQYPVEEDCDYNGDGTVDGNDATYLLYHTMFPNVYPID